MRKLSITELDLSGKTVFIRVDFNVPIEDGVVTDDTRIKGAVPTIEYAISKGAKIVLASHLGRPAGVPEEIYSLKPVATALSAIIGTKVGFVTDCIGEEVDARKSGLLEGEVLLLENLRFHGGEKNNDADFARSLVRGIDIYVNDAFGTAHRAHASTVGVTEFVTHCAAGLLMEKELKVLSKVLNDPERPFVAILGGAKVSDKIPVIKSLITKKVDKLLIGGAMAYTFFKAEGFTVGKSLVEDDMMPTASRGEIYGRGGRSRVVFADGSSSGRFL